MPLAAFRVLHNGSHPCTSVGSYKSYFSSYLQEKEEKEVIYIFSQHFFPLINPVIAQEAVLVKQAEIYIAILAIH